MISNPFLPFHTSNISERRTLSPLSILRHGVPMALNLMKAGHKLTVWNRTAAACQPLVDAGATLAATAAEACAATEVTFVMVSTPEAALACAEAAAPGLGAGKGYVDVSTVDAGTSQVRGFSSSLSLKLFRWFTFPVRETGTERNSDKPPTPSCPRKCQPCPLSAPGFPPRGECRCTYRWYFSRSPVRPIDSINVRHRLRYIVRTEDFDSLVGNKKYARDANKGPAL